MRRKFLIAALLSTTALVPARADAGVVSAFISGLTGIVTNAGIVGAVAGSLGVASPLAGAFAVGAFLGGTVVGRLLLGVGLSALAASFLAPPSLPTPAARMGNFAQPISYVETVYGRTRKGGPIGFTGAQGGRRFYVPILAAHEIEGVVEHWLDEWTVGVDGSITDWRSSNLLTSNDSVDYTGPGFLGASGGGVGRIDFFSGASGQTANAGLVDQFTEITSDYDFAGLAGATVWAKKPEPKYFSDIYPLGREWGYAPVVDGHNGIYDPRSGGSTGYTRNAALILAHWLTDRLGREVDWDAVAVEADVCDETVTDRDGNTLPRWRIGGTISDDQSFETQRGQLAGACDAFLFERTDGKVGFFVGRWIAPTVTLSSDDFFVLRLQQGQTGADAPSEVQVIYTEPASAWREAPAAVWVEDASARRIRDEPQLYMVTDHNQAARLSKRIAKARRPEWSLSGTIGPIGYELLGQRFFTLEHAVHGTIHFEVSEIYRTGPMTFEITAVSAPESDFAFDAAEEEGEPPQRLIVESDFVLADPDSVTATAGDAGTIVVGWTAVDDFVTTEVRWRADGATEWQYAVITEAGASEYIITGLVDGETYEVQVRHRSGSTETDWVPDPALEVDAVANANAPDSLTAFSTSLVGGNVIVSWTAPNDANYAGTRVYRGTSATFSAASVIATEFGPPNTADTYDDISPAADTYYYWAAPINSSGVEGTESGPETETVT